MMNNDLFRKIKFKERRENLSSAFENLRKSFSRHKRESEKLKNEPSNSQNNNNTSNLKYTNSVESIVTLLTLNETAKITQYTNSLLAESEILEGYGTQFFDDMDDMDISNFNRLLGNTSSLISKAYRSLIRKQDELKNYRERIWKKDITPPNTIRSGLNATKYKNLDHSLSFAIPINMDDHKRFQQVIELVGHAKTSLGNVDSLFERLQNIWGDFEELNNNTIIKSTLSLLYDLYIAIDENFLLEEFIETLGHGPKDDELEGIIIFENKILTNGAGYEAKFNQAAVDSKSTELWNNYFTKFSLGDFSAISNSNLIDCENFRTYSILVDVQNNYSKTWSLKSFYSKDLNGKSYSKSVFIDFIDRMRVLMNEQYDILKIRKTTNLLNAWANSSSCIVDIKPHGGHEKSNTVNLFDKEILLQLKHKDIAKILSFCHDCSCNTKCNHNLRGIVIEPGLFSFDFLTELGCITKRIVIQTAYSVAAGMAYLCKQKVVHVKLILSNILLCIDGIKISDFSSFYTIDDVKLNSLAHKFSTHIAPEVLENGNWNSQSDVYSYGILIFYLYLQISVYDSILLKLLKDIPVTRSTYRMEEPLKSLIGSCINPEPNLRPTFDSIEKKLMLYRNDYAAKKLNGPSHYLCLNILRRSIVLLDPFKHVKLVIQWYMALLIELMLGIGHMNEVPTTSDSSMTKFRSKSVQEFIQWQIHCETCQNNIIEVLRNIAFKKK